jgi:hypothetical protein
MTLFQLESSLKPCFFLKQIMKRLKSGSGKFANFKLQSICIGVNGIISAPSKTIHVEIFLNERMSFIHQYCECYVEFAF